MKKKVKTGNIVQLVAALLGVVALLMMFMPGVSWKTVLLGKEVASDGINGFKMMFGGEIGGDFKYELQFNFMAFMSFVFLLVGLAGVILSLLLKGKIGAFLAIGGFLLAGIFFFLYRAVLPMSFKDITIGSTTISGKDALDAMKELGTTFSLGIGAIMAGILSLLASAASAVATFVIKK